jgi:hypothetical protein
MMERTRKPAKRVMPAQVDAEGNCAAGHHLTHYAYLYHGCRCPGAVTAHNERLQRERAQHRAWQERKFVAAGRRFADPWRGVWHDRDMRVDRIDLMMTIAGFRLAVSFGTRVAAVIVLDRVKVADETRYGRKLYDWEIAERLGIGTDSEGERAVQRHRAWVAKARRERPQRRLADVRDKAVRVARALEKRETNR